MSLGCTRPHGYIDILYWSVDDAGDQTQRPAIDAENLKCTSVCSDTLVTVLTLSICLADLENKHENKFIYWH